MVEIFLSGNSETRTTMWSPFSWKVKPKAADAIHLANIQLPEVANLNKKPPLPKEDLADPSFDQTTQTAPRGLLIILSTPRSGSTLLCELLRINNGCLAHEYFQPFRYLPVLSARWGCQQESEVDTAQYVRQLLRHRVTPNGWLGINLHGSHIGQFLKAESFFRDVPTHYVHLQRQDLVEQAISYSIASRSRRWSSHFPAAPKPKYDYQCVLGKLHRIQHQNALIQAFLSLRGSQYLSLTYEDLVREPEPLLRLMPCVPSHKLITTGVGLKKQSSPENLAWKKRFSEDLLRRGA